MFWGLKLKTGVSQTVKFGHEDMHITMAVLAPNKETTNAYVSLFANVEGVVYLLCHLKKNMILQANLDLHFESGSEVVFFTKGAEACVHLTGYLLERDPFSSAAVDECIEENKRILINSIKQAKLQVKALEKEQASVNDQTDEEEEEESEMEHDDEEEEEEDDDDSADDEKQSSTSGKSPALKPKKVMKSETNSTPPPSKDKKLNKQVKFTPSNSDASTSKKNANRQSLLSKTPKPSVKKLSEGLVVEDLRIGSGPEAKSGKKVLVNYVGKLTETSVIFDQTKGKPLKFKLGKGEVIKGWDLGLEGMKVGGKRRIVVPPKLGYGNKDNGPIPANSSLTFDVELKMVK